MKNALKSSLVIFLILLASCVEPKDFDKYLGTWEPIDDNPYTEVSKLQIVKRTDIYILIVEVDLPFKHLFYYVCQPSENHLIVYPSKNTSTRFEGKFELTEPFEIYFDENLKCVFALNYAYKSSPNKIIEIKDNTIKPVIYK